MGLTEIAGYYTRLQTGIRELGIDCTFVDLSQDPLGYGGGDKSNFIVKLTKTVSNQRAKTPKSNLFLRGFWKILQQLLQIPLFFWAMFRHDVFIFSAGYTFCLNFDLPILKWFKKSVVCVFHGSDSRPPYINGYLLESQPISQIIKLSRRKKRQVKTIEKYANFVVSSPLHAHFFEKPIIPIHLLGFPIEPSPVSPDHEKKSDPKTIRILHAPSHPAKGTIEIQEAIKSLQSKGIPIEFIVLAGRSNKEVLQEIARCDFIVDQLYFEGPIGMFATEAAASGKLTVVGTPSTDSWEIYPLDRVPPVYRCEDDEIQKAIETVVTNEPLRKEIGRKAQRFVAEHWTPKQVAQRYVDMIHGTIKPEWKYEPLSLRYIYGMGISKERLKKLVRELIKVGGKEALQLQDKPALEIAFLEFSNSL